MNTANGDVTRQKKYVPMKRKFVMYFLVSILVPLIISSIINHVLLSINTGKNAIVIFSEITAQTGENIDMVLNNVENVATGIAFNADIQNIVQGSGESDSEKDFIKQKVVDLILGNFRLFLGMVNNIVIFSTDGKVVATMEGYNPTLRIKEYDWYERLSKSSGENVWISSHVDRNDFSSDNQPVISLVKKIRFAGNAATGNVGKDIGYLLINVKEKEIDNILSRVRYGKSGTLFIIDNDSRIVSHRDKKLIGTKFNARQLADYQGGKFLRTGSDDILVTHSTQRNNGWRLIGIVDKAEIMRDSNLSLMISIIASIVLLAAFIILAVILSESISRPIKDLQLHMKQVETGSFKIQWGNSGDIVEIADLEKGFNTMVFRLDKLINEVYEAQLKEKALESAVKQAEIRALQQQINPHFLYNTLDSINWMASLNGNESIAKMVTALGDFFRSSISNGINQITIEEEIKNVSCYVYIQQIRYSSKLEVRMEVQEEVKKYLTMKLLLQPIVENSIIHGIEPKRGKGTIVIKVLLVGDFVRFSVKDDGIGISGNKPVPIDAAQDGNGIGLKNVEERLKLIYRDKYAMTIHSTPGIGTEVIIDIPVETPG